MGTFFQPMVEQLKQQRGDNTPGSPYYVPPAVAASASPAPGSTITVARKNGAMGAASGDSGGTGKTLLGA